MTFKVGMKRPANAGKKKGTVNKTSLLVREIIENKGINIVDMILFDLQDLEPRDRVAALIQIMPYIYPKLTAAQITGSVEGITITVNDYTVKKE